MKWKYWPEGYSPEDGYELKNAGVYSDHESVAEDAADDFHSNHDGWKCRWPITFVVESPEGVIKKFSVDRETFPAFLVIKEVQL